MNYGINPLSILPVRSHADHKSEMVNQLLFGEQFTIIEEDGEWAYVEGALDGYRGWINSTSILSMDQAPAIATVDPMEVIPQPVRVSNLYSGENSFLILPGSTLPGLDPETGVFSCSHRKFKVHSPVGNTDVICSHEKLSSTALTFLNAPYLWGGRSLFGIDCSGLAQLIYKICGIIIPRDASQQVKSGRALSFISEAQPGDLAFFARPGEEISHVGMVLEEGKIIHASGKVKIESFDHQGIFSKDKQDYSHFLRVIHRYLHE